MFTGLEIRRIIEESFRPMECHCTLGPGQSLQVRIADPNTGRIDLLVTGISTANLTSSRAISELIAELRYDLSINSQRNLEGFGNSCSDQA